MILLSRYRTFYFFCFFILVIAPLKAQNIDSLKQVVNTSMNDTLKMNALVKLSELCDVEDILQYAEPAIALAEEKLKTSASNPVSHTFYLKRYADALNNSAYYHNEYYNFEKALPYYKKALKIYEELKDKHSIASSFCSIGFAQMNLKNKKIALEYFEKGLQIAVDTKDSVVLAPLYNNIATVYSKEGKLSLALEQMHKALDIYRGMKNKTGIATQLSSIADVYEKQEDYEKGQKYNFEALKIYEEADAKFEITRMLHNIAHTYMLQGEMEQAKSYYKRALNLSKKLDHKYGIAYCYNGLGRIYFEEGQLDSASLFLTKGLKTNEEVGNKSGACISNLYLGKYYLEKGDIPKALEFTKRSFAIAKELNTITYLSSGAQLLYKIYKLQGKTEQALEMYEYYIVQRDSINSQAARTAVLRSELQLEFDKKESHLKAEKEKDILKLERDSVRRKYWAIVTFSSAAFLVLILILIIARSNSIKKHKQIEFEKSVLEFEQKALRAQMNPHFIFNAINSIQRYILNKDQQSAYDYLAKFAKLIRIVLNNSQEKHLSLQQELEMIKLYVELEQLRFSNKFDFNLEVDESVSELECCVPAMLIQPYVENAIWHGLMNLGKERKGILNVRVSQSESILKIVIEDNGIGREKAKQHKEEDKHRSVGMALTEQRLLMINKMQEYENAKVIVTDLYDDNEGACGTRIEIFLPVNER